MSAIDSTITFNRVTATTHSFTFNNVAGTFLLIGFNNNLGTSTTVSSIKYNGVDLTVVDTQTTPNANFATVWRLSNPALGSNTFEITLSSTNNVVGAVQSYTGVDLANPIDASSKGTSWNLTTAMSLPITTVTANARLFAHAYIARNVSSLATGTTSVHTANDAGLTIRSTNAIANAGATSLDWTANATEFQGHVIVALRQASGGPVRNSQLTMMGVG